jgi:hypothetical protein
VNELELIRSQLRTERERVSDVARACATAGATEGLRQVGAEYLVFMLNRFDERDQRLAEQSSVQPSSLDQIISLGGTSREALAKLAAATAAAATVGEGAKADRWSAFAQFCAGPWRLRRDAIDALHQQTILRIAQWRAVSCVDADSILEERTRYARVQAKLSP